MSLEETYPQNRALYKFPISVVALDNSTIHLNYDKTDTFQFLLEDVCYTLEVESKYFSIAIRNNKSFGFIDNNMNIYDFMTSLSKNCSVVHLRIKILSPVVAIDDQILMKHYATQIFWNIKNYNKISSVENYIELAYFYFKLNNLKFTIEHVPLIFPDHIVERYHPEFLMSALKSLKTNPSAFSLIWQSQKRESNFDFFIYPLYNPMCRSSILESQNNHFGYKQVKSETPSILDRWRKNSIFTKFSSTTSTNEKYFWFSIHTKGIRIYEDVLSVLYETGNSLRWEDMMKYEAIDDWILRITFRSKGIKDETILSSDYRFLQPPIRAKKLFNARAIEKLMNELQLNHEMNKFLSRHPTKLLERAETCSFKERYVIDSTTAHKGTTENEITKESTMLKCKNLDAGIDYFEISV